MHVLRALSLTLTTSILFACSDSGGKLTAGLPGQGSNQTNDTASEQTSTAMSGGDTTVTDSGATSTTGEPTDPTTEAPPTSTTLPGMSTTTTTTTTTTGVDATTEPPDGTTNSTTDDSNGFIPPDDLCGAKKCAQNEICLDVGDQPTCLAGCSPLNPNCALDEVCVPSMDIFVCAPDASGDKGKVGDACAFANVCDPGNLCLAGDFVAGCNSQGCCSAFCDLDLPDPCLKYGMQCIGWFEQGMEPPGFDDLGVCMLP